MLYDEYIVYNVDQVIPRYIITFISSQLGMLGCSDGLVSKNGFFCH